MLLSQIKNKIILLTFYCKLNTFKNIIHKLLKQKKSIDKQN